MVIGVYKVQVGQSSRLYMWIGAHPCASVQVWWWGRRISVGNNERLDKGVKRICFALGSEISEELLRVVRSEERMWESC